MQISVLDLQQVQFPHLVTIIDQMRIYSTERLWKQLSDCLLLYMKDPQVSQGTNLKDLYEGFVKGFYLEIDEFKLVKFLLKAADQYGDMENRISFLGSFNLQESQTQLMIRLKSAYYSLQQDKVEEVNQKLKQYRQQIERMQDVDPQLYSLLYYLAFNFYRVKKNFEEFYKSSLQYLAYTPDTDIPNDEKVTLSLEMAFAVLISPSIYNYSELLSQTVLLALKESQHTWVYSILETFNKGDVTLLNHQIQQFNAQIQSQPLLSSNVTILNEKIRIMSFLELAFSLPKNNRVCTFQQIAQVTFLDEDHIEPLVMRTISKGLIKGSINQVNQTVAINYIVPRVLTKDKIEIMLKKFDQWEKTLKVLQNEMDTNQQQLK